MSSTRRNSREHTVGHGADAGYACHSADASRGPHWRRNFSAVAVVGLLLTLAWTSGGDENDGAIFWVAVFLLALLCFAVFLIVCVVGAIVWLVHRRAPDANQVS